MKTEDCDLATSRHVALNKATIESLHTMCPGGFRDMDSNVHHCDCDCHGQQPRDLDVALLPVRTVPVSRPEPVPVRQDRPAPVTGTGRRCLCECGEEVSATARFRPGHDAKLKSRLLKKARAGSIEARLELHALGWGHFI